MTRSRRDIPSRAGQSMAGHRCSTAAPFSPPLIFLLPLYGRKTHPTKNRLGRTTRQRCMEPQSRLPIRNHQPNRNRLLIRSHQLPRNRLLIRSHQLPRNRLLIRNHQLIRNRPLIWSLRRKQANKAKVPDRSEGFRSGTDFVSIECSSAQSSNSALRP